MKTVFITGAARRIGRGIALKFAEKGWNVIVNYNTSKEKAIETAEEIKKLGARFELIYADVRDEKQVARAFKLAYDKMGVPDVLINNAGIYPEKRELTDIDIDFWDNVININLRGELLCAREFTKYAQDGAKIINFASLGAYEIWKQRMPYNVSKAGVIQLTKALARELAPKISVNSVSPGSIFIPDEVSPQDGAIKEDRIPMKRYGSIDDVFDAVYFFATCSPYITGQNLNIDGGFHLSN